MPSTNDILAVIMGGGQGSRLYPLTKVRAKPAVPIGGKYRLIDIPISNCINSDINRIAVLTQFNSVSLHRHITQTYNFDPFHRGWVQIWAAEQTFGNQTWYQGTADAVRKQLLEIHSTGAKYILVLAGDHLYRMNYAEMAQYHWEKDADISIAVQPVSTDQASRFGILKRDANGFLTDFAEKPKDPEILKKFISRDDEERPYLGSMGIYFFKTEVLIELLKTSNADDFGGEVLPNAIQTKKVVGFDFDDYWEDIGTMRTFYEATLSLTQPDPPFNFYDPHSPIYTHPRFLPGTVLEGAKLEKVFLSDGGYIGQAEIYHSVIGLRSYIQDNVFIKDTILMGADYYEANAHYPHEIPLGIGKNSHIEGALIDKNVRIGSNVVIKPFPRGTEKQLEHWAIRDGIVVIPKSTVVYNNTVIAPD
ncbi:MAG: glucose-1-phosphate adenylyltransferase [Thermoplasmata archaeon]|nr:MAG: glucose-1-phosphate adenylyltransferase [Anaerolineaceae bacterium 4572_5.2]RLD04548.1 MAG: glucose-1-phosphate adenylyltransferase [Chloroflexota bacterium]RLF31372.1 MAG: glucose-1-phosphate adenylyltransferase [Thermoplasmata archaeon]